jgi:hypothetical protein
MFVHTHNYEIKTSVVCESLDAKYHCLRINSKTDEQLGHNFRHHVLYAKVLYALCKNLYTTTVLFTKNHKHVMKSKRVHVYKITGLSHR